MNEENNRYSGMFTMLGMLFVTCLVVSNLIAGKIWSVYGTISVQASVILFPITYILSDVFTEVYGFKKARFIIWTGFACNLVAVLAYVITIILPYPKYWLGQDAFGVVLGLTPRVLVASFAGYLFGEFANSIIMSKLKVKSEGKKLWVRIIVSTLAGEAIDTIIFVTVSFAGMIPVNQLIRMIHFQYTFKVLFEAVFMPVTYRIISRLKKKEGLDVIDHDIRYRLF